MDLSLFTGGAILGAVIGFWNQIKSFLWSIVSILIQKADITTEEAHNTIIAYLYKEYKHVSIYDQVFGAQNESYRTGKYGLVAYEQLGKKSMIFFDRSKKCFINFPFVFSIKQENPKGNGTEYPEVDTNKVFSSLLFIRGTINIDQIIKEATKVRNNLAWNIEDKEGKTDRFEIFYLPDKETDNQKYFQKQKDGLVWYKQNQYRLIGTEKDELGRKKTTQGSAISNLYFPDDIKKLIRSIELWVKSEQWYKEKNIPWKRGWLLYGPPGTGKTALVRAFAEDLDLPIYVFSLAQMSNGTLMDCWKNLQLNIPCIALIEDIDNIFDGRKNICQKVPFYTNTSTGGNEDNDTSQTKVMQPLTFDCFINCLDGVDKSIGVFTIITTNNIHKVDEAIGKPNDNGEYVSSRPGRIDKVIKLSYMSKDNRREMAKKILSEYLEKMSDVEQHIDSIEKETSAQFQEYCAQIALEEHWRREGN